MKTRVFVTFFVIITALTVLKGQEAAIESMLADTALTGTSYSICFADAVTGEVIFGYDEDRNLASASVMKLYPTSVALSLLRADYRFSTRVFMSGRFNKRRGILYGDIVILGGGDPALGSSYFADHYGDVTGQWAEALAAAGLRRVTGRVAAAESIYDHNPVPGGWSWADLGNYYGAGVYDINYNDNKYNIFVTGYSEGMPAVIDSVDKYGANMQIGNYLTSSGKSDNGYVYNAPYSTNAWISGTVPADSSIILKASMPDPPFTLVNQLNRAMKLDGIKIEGSPVRERVSLKSDMTTPVCSTFSTPLSEIIMKTNHESVNLYAELLRKHLGWAIGSEGSFSAGSEVIRSFLDSIGCEPYKAVILDGSGLSPNNNISALMTTRLLVHMYNSKDSAAFLSSLPAAGVSGTMKGYFRKEVFKGRVIAKTGSIGSVRSFAGYVTTKSGRTLAFTMIANGFTVPWSRITNGMEKIVEETIITY
ncbi:MAG TPA: D-alanyl-D-alanine carboxypeptidase/D-alanyl-D-alanine-endopeptidase [Bacteroidales bacterium]|nr:D-alanyl-D-alanine carboxypeptidase/D-alanyl-D-alanine-endopeptidase [Bacteroidales bacterium]